MKLTEENKELNDEIYQKILEILDRLGQPTDTSQAGILELPEYVIEFGTQHSQENVEN